MKKTLLLLGIIWVTTSIKAQRVYITGTDTIYKIKKDTVPVKIVYVKGDSILFTNGYATRKIKSNYPMYVIELDVPIYHNSNNQPIKKEDIIWTNPRNLFYTY